MDNVGGDANSVWKDGFLFLGNQVVLDFLNTRPVQNDQPAELLTDFGALLRWFQAAELISPQTTAKLERQWKASPQAQQTLEAMRELREKLRKSVIALERDQIASHSLIEELNRMLAEHPMLTQLKITAGKIMANPWFEAKTPKDLFAPLAHSAAELFSAANYSRIRQCGSCVLHFHDTSKKGTRRWCSMQLCGNRLKVAAYAERHRGLAKKSPKR